MNFNIEYEQEEDGRWLAEVIGLLGVLSYASTPDEAMIKAESLALRVLAAKNDLKPEYDLNNLAVKTIGLGRKCRKK